MQGKTPSKPKTGEKTMTTAQILAAARKNNLEPSRLSMSANRECRNNIQRRAYIIAAACEQIGLENYGGARCIIRDAIRDGVNLPACIKAI
jgi:hypothetical protein